MFIQSAEIYDAIYAWKDYRAESARVTDLIRQHGPPGARWPVSMAARQPDVVTMPAF
jgi:hypothetical protein